MMKHWLKVRARQRRLRAARARIKLRGTTSRPRLSVFRSSRHMFAQLIDDERGVTILSLHDAHLSTTAALKKKSISSKGADGVTKVSVAFQLGEELARKALAHNIKAVVFDRGRYAYHGRVKAVAEGARAGGLKF